MAASAILPALTRRRLAVAGLCACASRPAAAALVVPPQPQIVCKVIRAGSDIGRAVYAFTPHADRLTVAIDVEIRVRAGFITFFRYSHHNTETWQRDQLVGFDAHTLRNGVNMFSRASWNGRTLDVDGNVSGRYTAPPGAIATTYWNARTVSAPLIDTENGRLLRETVTAVGTSPAVQSNGAKLAAREFRLTGDMRITLWYDSADNWAGMKYYAHDGSVLTYEKT